MLVKDICVVKPIDNKKYTNVDDRDIHEMFISDAISNHIIQVMMHGLKWYDYEFNPYYVLVYFGYTQQNISLGKALELCRAYSLSSSGI